MRRILIVGAGQCGLQLGLTLLAEGYEVTIMSARTPAEIRAGWPTSTQAMFGQALEIERSHGLSLWDDVAPRINGMQIQVAMPPGELAIDIHAPMTRPGQSTDQRVKMSRWLELFTERGGTVIYQGITTQELDALAALRRYDLTIVAAGRGELGALFDRNPDRSPFTEPQRSLAVAYLHGVEPNPSYPESSGNFNGIPGVGEMFVIPAYTLSGPCDILFWEAAVGGPADRWGGKRMTPDELLGHILDCAREYVPWVHDRCHNVRLTDPKATLSGRFTPMVRYPVGHLPSGGVVLGAADVVLANDPITGQGSNTAAKCAEHYLRAIVAHGHRAFDEDWMNATFESFWEDVGTHSVAWTTAMLREMPEYMGMILGTAAQHQPTATRFVDGFSDPSDFHNFFLTEEAATAYLASLNGG